MKTAHKKTRIMKGRVAMLTGLIAFAAITGYMCKKSYPAESPSVWYMLFLASLLAILGYAHKYVGRKPEKSRQRA